MNKNSFTIAAVAVLAAVFATGATTSSEVAFASGHHSSNPLRQTFAQANSCGNGSLPLDIKCQNLGSQIQGSHNAVNVIGIQPSNSGEMNHGDDHKNDGGSSDNHDGSSQQPGNDNQKQPGNDNQKQPGNDNQKQPGNDNQKQPGNHQTANNNQKQPGNHQTANNNQKQPMTHQTANNNQKQPVNGISLASSLQNSGPSGNPAIGAGT